jgi:hypothetical protein
MHLAAATQLRGILASRAARGELAGPGGPPDLDRIVDVLVQYLRAEQAVLASAAEIQEAINVVLERPPPKRLLSVRDFNAGYSMGSRIGAFPYLFYFLEDELGIRVECTASAIEVSDRRAS